MEKLVNLNVFLFALLLLTSISQEGAAQHQKIGNEWVLEEALNYSKSDPEKSAELATQVITDTKSPLLKTQALHLLGRLSKKAKDYSKSEFYYKQSYDISLDLKDANVSAKSLRDLADVQRFMKKFDEAIYHVDASIALSKENGMFDAMVSAYNVKGNIYKSAKRYEESLKSFKEGLRVIEENEITDGRSRAYSRISTIYARLNQLDQAIAYKIKALNEEEKSASGNDEEIVKHLIDLSTYTRWLADYSSALQYSLRALDAASLISSSKLKQRILLNLTIIYRKLSVYDTSLKYAIELRQSYEADGNKQKIATANIQIALIYDNLKQYDSAKDFYQRALDVPIEESGIKYNASASRGKASILHKLGDNQQALVAAENAKSLFLQIEDRAGIETADRLIGEINASLGNVVKAREAFESALTQSRNLGASWSEANNLIHIGKLLVDSDLDGASMYANEGISIAERSDAKSLVLDGYETMTKIAHKKGDFKSAYEYSLLAKNLASQINKDNIAKRIADLEIINEVAEKERTIELLKRKARIDELELASQASRIQLLNKKNTLSDLKLERERYMRVLFVIAAVAALILLFVLYRLTLNSRKDGIVDVAV